MQDKTNLANWDSVFRSKNAVLQIKATVDGVEYLGYNGSVGVWSAKTSTALFERLQAGNCAVRMLDLEMFPQSGVVISRAAEIKLYARLAILDGNNQPTTVTGYIPKGTFYIDTRETEESSGMLTVQAYDAMRKTEVSFAQSGNQGIFPMTDINAVNEICQRIGVTLDPRTQAILTRGYQIQYTGYGEGAYTMREVLGYIGAMYAGNWIINDLGYAQLIVIGDIPEETNYLVDENGDPITIGGVKILV